MNLIATIKNNNGTVLSGKTIPFLVNGNLVGSAVTSTTGTATLPYTITQSSGTYTITAQYAQDTTYAASSNTNTLTVSHTPTRLVLNGSAMVNSDVDSVSPNDVKTASNTVNTGVTGYNGSKVDLTAELTDNANNPLSGQIIHFYINGVAINTVITNTQGIASIPYTITQSSGTYTIQAQYLQDSIYSPSNSTNTLTVPHTPTKLIVGSISSYYRNDVVLTAKLVNVNNLSLSGKSINFSVNGKYIGSASTNASGTATYNYVIQQTFGKYVISAQYLTTSVYAGTSSSNYLTVMHAPTKLVLNPASGLKGNKINLTAKLIDTHNNLPLHGETIYFSVNGVVVGSAITNSLGIATYVYTIKQNNGIYSTRAQFDQTSIYLGVTNSSTLKV